MEGSRKVAKICIHDGLYPQSVNDTLSNQNQQSVDDDNGAQDQQSISGANGKTWNWRYFYLSTGGSSEMADTVFPFVKFDRHTPDNDEILMVKPKGNERANTLYKRNFIEYINDNNNPMQQSWLINFKEQLNKYKADKFKDKKTQYGENYFVSFILTNDFPAANLIERLYHIEDALVSYSFGGGIWDEYGSGDEDYRKLAALIAGSTYVQGRTDSGLQQYRFYGQVGDGLTVDRIKGMTLDQQLKQLNDALKSLKGYFPNGRPPARDTNNCL